MSHPYPPHDPRWPYSGKYQYFLTFCTDQRGLLFEQPEPVALVLDQILRSAREWRFEITAYCFMPDHVHLLVTGTTDDADCRAFIKSAKQYSAYYFRRRYGMTLWQRYGFERVIRSDTEAAFTIGYIVSNPVRAGLVEHPTEYKYVGSVRYTLAELLEICEYRSSGSSA